MSLFDKARDALTPAATPEQLAEARQKASELDTPGGWLATILDHHVQLEDAFAAVKSAGGDSRGAALKDLGVLLTGHAIAEESAIYPAMATGGEKGDANHAYEEQATVKMEMAKLEKLDPMSREFLDKLEEIRSAVAHHMYEEEGTWFPDLAKTASTEDQQMIAKHYGEAFGRFVGEPALA